MHVEIINKTIITKEAVIDTFDGYHDLTVLTL